MLAFKPTAHSGTEKNYVAFSPPCLPVSLFPPCGFPLYSQNEVKPPCSCFYSPRLSADKSGLHSLLLEERHTSVKSQGASHWYKYHPRGGPDLPRLEPILGQGGVPKAQLWLVNIQYAGAGKGGGAGGSGGGEGSAEPRFNPRQSRKDCKNERERSGHLFTNLFNQFHAGNPGRGILHHWLAFFPTIARVECGLK